MVQAYVLSAALVVASVVTATAGPQTLSDDNWAGIVNFADGIVEVSGDIIIPDCTPGLPYMYYSDYTTDGWIGMNGWDLPPASNASLNGGLLQTGVTCNANAIYHPGNFSFSRVPTSYEVWTEWAPGPPIFFNDTDFQPGDVVHAKVTKLSASSGTTYIKNRRTGHTHTWKYVDQNHTLLYHTNAEWIVESETYVVEGLNLAGGTLTANFTEWRIEHAQYRTRHGKIHLASSYDSINCVLNGTTIAVGENPAPGTVIIKNTTPANFTLQVA